MGDMGDLMGDMGDMGGVDLLGKIARPADPLITTPSAGDLLGEIAPAPDLLSGGGGNQRTAGWAAAPTTPAVMVMAAARTLTLTLTLTLTPNPNPNSEL